MNNGRYENMWADLDARGEGALGAFLTLGDPDLETSAALLDAAVAGGADMLEVGIPFSDPVADGPVIQAASERALAASVTPEDCLTLIADCRKRHPSVPIGILTYANIVASRGLKAFAADLVKAGADSLLVADVPSLEAEAYATACRDAGVHLVLISAPNTPRDKISTISGLSGGYSYCVARAGVTGQRSDMALDHGDLFAALDGAGAPPPVLGFGISTPDHVRQGLAAGAKGVISGSAIVAAAHEAEDKAGAVRALVADLKEATR